MICDGDKCIVGFNQEFKVYTVKKGKSARFKKHDFNWTGCIGQPYGLTWLIEKRELKVESENSTESISKILSNIDSALDNRNQNDTNKDSASMEQMRDEILKLREAGESNDTILEKVIEKNKNFESKFRLTQEKFIQAKQKKHGGRIQILRPTQKLILKQLLSREQNTSSMDVQTLSMMLNLSNVHANSNILVCESAAGILTGAVMARQLSAGKGCLVSVFNGQLGDTPALHGCTTYGFDDDVWSKMYYYPSRCLGKAVLEGTFENQPLPNLEIEKNLENETKENGNDENEGEPEAKKSKLSKEQLENIRIERKRKRIEKYAKSIEHLKNGMDGLLLATKNHPIMWLFMLIRFVKSGRPFTVFCERREPLIECFVRLHDERKATNLQISDCFEREIQVLPERTHPLVMMPGNRGYILSGITVTESSENKMES